jgi:prepilin-type N-terminal cleavage/methylation domain-containing protein
MEKRRRFPACELEEPDSRQVGARGFTLVELLVSIGVLSILVVLLLGILNQLSSTFTEIRAQIYRHQNGQAILGLIASDLRVAMLPQNRTDKNSLELLVDPLSLLNASPNNYLFPHAIFWQAPIASNTTNGNIAEVGYFIQWDATTNPNNPKPILCRFFVNPSDSNYLIYSTTQNWLTPAIIGAVAPATTSPYQGWFADNVIGLWVRCLDANGVPITQTAAGVGQQASCQTTNYSFDSRLGYLSSNAGGASGSYIPKYAYYDPGSKQNVIAGALPSTIEIAIVLLDSQAALRIKAPYTSISYAPFTLTPAITANPAAVSPYTKNSPADFWNDINFFLSNLKASQPLVAKGAHVYSIRVPLVNGG